MTLSAPTRLNRWKAFRPAKTAPRGSAGPAASQGTVTTFHATQATPAQFVLMVDFTSPEGRTWWAVGVGDTLVPRCTSRPRPLVPHRGPRPVPLAHHPRT